VSVNFPKESLALVSERGLKRISTRGDIKFLVIEETYKMKSSRRLQKVYLVAPLGRVGGGVSKDYNPYIYSKWKFSDNVEFLVRDAKPKESIEHIIDMCKLFTDNHEILEIGKKLIKLKLKYQEVMKDFLTKIKADIEAKSNTLERKR